MYFLSKMKLLTLQMLFKQQQVLFEIVLAKANAFGNAIILSKNNESVFSKVKNRKK